MYAVPDVETQLIPKERTMKELAALSAEYHASASHLIALDMFGWILFPSVVTLLIALLVYFVTKETKP